MKVAALRYSGTDLPSTVISRLLVIGQLDLPLSSVGSRPRVETFSVSEDSVVSFELSEGDMK